MAVECMNRHRNFCAERASPRVGWDTKAGPSVHGVHGRWKTGEHISDHGCVRRKSMPGACIKSLLTPRSGLQHQTLVVDIYGAMGLLVSQIVPIL